MSEQNVYGRKIQLPYNENLTDREFEELLYNIFTEHVERRKKPFVDIYDSAHLMPGVAEAGRDIFLVKNNKNVGLIQCKKVKTNLDKKSCAKEILKFSLNVICDPSLVSDNTVFTYYFVTSTGFSKNALALLSTFSSSIYSEQELQSWVESLIKEYKSFKKLKYIDIEDRLMFILQNIQVVLILPTQINLWLSEYYLIANHFFSSVNIVINTDQNKSIGNTEPYLITQNVEALEQAEVFWKNLNPGEAKVLVDTVDRTLDRHNFPTEIRNSLLSKVYFLKAFIEADLGKIDKFESLIIKAYNTQKESIKYKERVMKIYYERGEIDRSVELAHSILEKEEENPRAWLIVSLTDPKRVVPKIVSEMPDFKVGQISDQIRRNNNLEINQVKIIFNSELKSLPIPDYIDRLNLYYWNYVAKVAMSDVVQMASEVSITKPKNLLDNDQLKYAHKILSLIVYKVKNTVFEYQVTFQVAKFDLYLCQYFLANEVKEEIELAREMYYLYFGKKLIGIKEEFTTGGPLVKVIPERIIEVVAVLLQQDQNNYVISIDKILKENILTDISIDIYILIAIAYKREDQFDKRIEAYSTYINKLKFIDQYAASQCCDIIRSLQLLKFEASELLNVILKDKEFETDFISPLIEAYFYCVLSENKNIAKEKAEIVKPHWIELNLSLKTCLAIIYTEIKEWPTAIELWKELCGNDIKESDALKGYLISLYESRLEVETLIEKLLYWRSNFTPDLKLTEIESSLYRKLINYKKLSEVSAYGMKYFPDKHTFWIDGVRAFHRLNDTTNLSPLLDDRIFSFDLRPEVVLSLAHIYIINGKENEGLEACYRIVRSNWSNPRIKQAYVSISTNYKSIEQHKDPEIVLVGMFVRIHGENKRQLIEITPESVKYDKFIINIVGLRVNDKFTFKKRITGQVNTYTVEAIFDKYRGLSARIFEEVFDKPLHGMSLQGFQSPGEQGAQELLDEIQSSLGPEGTKHQIIVEDKRRKFANVEIGFLELTQQAFRGDPIAAWHYITSDYGDGFPIMSTHSLSRNQRNFSSAENLEFVLDFTSLLTIYHVSVAHNLQFNNKKFILSQYIFDYLSIDLEKRKNEQVSTMSISATSERVVAYSYSEDIHAGQLQFLINLNEWVNQNCQADYAWERIAWEAEKGDKELEKLFSEENLIVSSYSDTLLLSNRPNRYLLTDDLFIRIHEVGFINWTTTEVFLRQIVSDEFEKSIWITLAKLNMRGLSLTAMQLYYSFSNNVIVDNVNSLYIKAIYSFMPQYNQDPNNWVEVIKFIKHVYSENYDFSYKRRVSLNMFKTMLTGQTEVSSEIIGLLLKNIDAEFYLLRNYVDVIKKDLLYAIHDFYFK